MPNRSQPNFKAGLNKSLSKLDYNWWGHVWRGLVVSRRAAHYRLMGRAVWLYLYFIIHADRSSGRLYRRIGTVSADMGVSRRTVQVWLKTLREGGYIATERTGRALIIQITKWRPIARRETR